MRTLIFRGLAGLLAILIAWLLVVGDHADRPARDLFSFVVVMVLFGLFALFGTGPAERFGVMMFGGEYPKKPAAGADKPASRSESS